MKLRINKKVKLEPTAKHLLARFPNGLTVQLPMERFLLIHSFDPPADMKTIGAASSDIATFTKIVNELRDMSILIPDDTLMDPAPLPPDLIIDKDTRFKIIYRDIRSRTMSTPEICYALYQAVQYIHSANIEGAILESGVWRGGNMALCARTLKQLGDMSRELYLCDTFAWTWPALSEWDTKHGQGTAEQRDAALEGHRNATQETLDEQLVSESAVREFVTSTGYPAERFHFVKGLIQDTLPENAPEKIAILRLDTDMYESTHHELVHLYPRLASGGVLLIDDYPTEDGCVKAVDEYFSEMGSRPFLSRIDTQGRIGIKP